MILAATPSTTPKGWQKEAHHATPSGLTKPGSVLRIRRSNNEKFRASPVMRSGFTEISGDRYPCTYY